MTGLTASILGVTGELVDLTSAPLVLAGSPGLFGVAPVTVGTVRSPALSAGSRRGRTRVDEWPVVVPIRILADDQQGLLEQVERLARLTDPARGDCIIQVTRPDGEQRQIVGHYSGGLTPSIESCESDSALVEIVFRCPDPFWHSPGVEESALTLPVTGSGVASVAWSAALPWSAAIPWNGWEPTDTGGVVVVEVDNRGSAPSWPEWRFHGSLTGVTATNLTSGRIWSWSVATHSTLTSVQEVVVVTHELSRSVRVAGVDKWRGLQPDRQDLWPLEPGVNELLIEVTGADGSAAGSLVWRRRHKTC